MEIFSSVWFVLLLYCSERLTIRHCFGIPVPTLSYYPNSFNSRNSWRLTSRETKYPEVNNEKFVFPSKQEESKPYFVAERSGVSNRDSGKIFFPDEFESETDRIFHPQNQALFPMNDHHRPSPVASTNTASGIGRQPWESSRDSVDGSSPKVASKTKIPAKKQMDDERIREALKEFYKWLKQSGNQRTRVKVTNCQGGGTPDGVADQSIVANGLKDQSCGPGKIRTSNGDCKAKVDI